MSSKVLLTCLTVGTLLITNSCLSAQNWPEWRGANRDGKVAGFKAPQTWPESLNEQWRVTVGRGSSSPALVDGKLYVFTRQGDEECIQAFSAADGKVLWQYKYAAPPVTGPGSSFPGPRSSPTVADGKVITLGVGGNLVCLEAATGTLVWRIDEYTAVPPYFTSMSPIVVDGICIAHLGGENSGHLLALDLASGKTKWEWVGDGPSYASPVLMTVAGEQHLVLQTEKHIMGLAVADGKPVWQIETPTERRFTNSVTPIVDGDVIYYTGQGMHTSAIKIAKEGDGFAAKSLWRNDELGTVFNTPVLKNGLLFAIDGRRGYFFCLSAKTGETAWFDSTATDRFASMLDAGSILLALPATSELIVFKPSGEQFDEVARIKLSDTKIYSHPIIAGNRIFIKDEETLALLTLD